MRDYSFLAANLIPDLAAYMGCEYSYVEWQMEHGWQLNHAAWLAAKPLTGNARQDFYRQNDTYMWELAGWHHGEDRRHVTDAVARFAFDRGVSSVVDYGGGLGDDLLAVAAILPDADCVLMEVNALCRGFAEWRAKKYGLANFRATEPVEIPPVDLMVCLDVLEHVEEPDELLTTILSASKHAVFNFSGNFLEKDFPMHLPKNQEVRERYATRMRAFKSDFSPDAIYYGSAAGGREMIREIAGTPFLLGSFVDAERQDKQSAVNVVACLKCTHQLIGGKAEAKFPIHKEYLNLPFSDAGICPTDGTSPYLMARSWLSNVEGMAREKGGKVLIHSYTGMGKAIRLVAAHLAGWKKAGYEGALKKLRTDLKITDTMLLPLPEFEKGLVTSLEDAPVAAPVPKGGERKGSKLRKPKL